MNGILGVWSVQTRSTIMLYTLINNKEVHVIQVRADLYETCSKLLRNILPAVDDAGSIYNSYHTHQLIIHFDKYLELIDLLPLDGIQWLSRDTKYLKKQKWELESKVPNSHVSLQNLRTAFLLDVMSSVAKEQKFLKSRGQATSRLLHFIPDTPILSEQDYTAIEPNKHHLLSKMRMILGRLTSVDIYHLGLTEMQMAYLVNCYDACETKNFWSPYTLNRQS